MDIAIIVIVVVAAVAIGWWLVTRQSGSESSPVAVAEDVIASKDPTSVEFDGTTAVVTYDVEVPDDGPDERLRDLLLKNAREATRGKGVDVERVSVRAWRGGHVTEVARQRLTVARSDDDGPEMAEASDFDPLGDLHNTDFGTGVGVARVVGELAPIGKELRLTDRVRSMLSAKGVDPATMTMTELTLAILEGSGYTISPGSMPGTYDASAGGVRTFLTIVDHEKGDYPELAEEAVESFVIRFMSSGADRGLLFTDKHGPFAVYDKEKRQPKIRFITRERLQTFVDSVAMR